MGRIFQYINRFPFLISFFLSRSAPVRLIFERWTRHDGYWKKYFSDIYKRYKSPPKLFYIIFLRLIINFFYYVRLSRGTYMYYIHACKFMHVLCVCFLFPYLVICFDNFLYIIIHLFSDRSSWDLAATTSLHHGRFLPSVVHPFPRILYTPIVSVSFLYSCVVRVNMQLFWW